MLYLVAPLQLFAVGDIRNGRLTCLSALGSGERIDKVAIKCPERGYQEDAKTTHKAEAQPRPPCHNRSYLSAGGERILSMNNRLSLIFLGEARPLIGQLPEILILLIYGSIFLRERQDYYSTPDVQSRSVECEVDSWMTEKCQRGENVTKKWKESSSEAAAYAAAAL